jgi:hypothetical protein
MLADGCYATQREQAPISTPPSYREIGDTLCPITKPLPDNSAS